MEKPEWMWDGETMLQEWCLGSYDVSVLTRILRDFQNLSKRLGL